MVINCFVLGVSDLSMDIMVVLAIKNVIEHNERKI